MKNKVIIILLIVIIGGFVYINFDEDKSSNGGSNKDENVSSSELVDDAKGIYDDLLSVENVYKMNVSRFHDVEDKYLSEENKLYYAMHLSEKDFVYNDNEDNYECDLYSSGISVLDFDECGFFKVSIDDVDDSYTDMFVESINFEDLNIDEEFYYNLFVSCNILTDDIECFRAIGGYTDDLYYFVSLITDEEVSDEEIVLTEKVIYVKYNFNEELYQVLENNYIEGNVSYDTSIFETDDNLEKLLNDEFDEKEKEDIFDYYSNEGDYIREVEHTFGIFDGSVYYSHSEVK